MILSRLLLLAAPAVTAATGVIPSTTDGRYTIGPTYTLDPAYTPCEDCPDGSMFNIWMPIAGTFFDCDNSTDKPWINGDCADGYCGQSKVQSDGPLGTRHITVYVPASYNDGDEVAVLIATENDGQVEGIPGVGGSWKAMADNLINNEDDDRSLPTFITIAIGLSGTGATGAFSIGACVSDKRDVELRTVSDDYAKFVDEDVLPFITNHPDIKKTFPNLKITDDPAGRVVYGISAGGFAAFQMAWWKPDRFGNVIAYSPSMMPPLSEDGISWNPVSEEYPMGAADFWVQPPDGQGLIMNQPAKPIGRIFFLAAEKDMGTPEGCLAPPFIDVVCDVSDNATGYDGPYDNFLEAGNKSVAAFEEKGYTFRYAFALNACHTDLPANQQDFPNTLVWALSDWKKKLSGGTNTPAPTASKATPASGAFVFLVTTSLAVITALFMV